MSIIDGPQGINLPATSKSRAYVVFDGITGKVLHIHYSVEFAHAASPREPAEARARRLASKHAGVKIDVLEVGPEQVNHGKPIRIDVTKRAVVVIDRPQTKAAGIGAV